jgi:sulfite reductase alpha subunit-like flavoprotein
MFKVFGCGNTTYTSYQAMGRFFDKKLAELGATKIFERGEGDSENDIETDFSLWKDKMLKHVSEQFGNKQP